MNIWKPEEMTCSFKRSISTLYATCQPFLAFIDKQEDGLSFLYKSVCIYLFMNVNLYVTLLSFNPTQFFNLADEWVLGSQSIRCMFVNLYASFLFPLYKKQKKTSFYKRTLSKTWANKRNSD